MAGDPTRAARGGTTHFAAVKPMADWSARPRRFLPVLSTGGYVWFVTVLPSLDPSAAVNRLPTWAPGLFGAVSLVLLLAAAFVETRCAQIGLGLYGFLGFATLAWACSRPLITEVGSRLFGVLAFVTYCAAWGALSKPEADADAPLTAPLVDNLKPWQASPRLALLVPASGAIFAMGLLVHLGPVAAQLSERPHVELLAHVLGLLGALLIVRQSAQWGSDAHFRTPASRLRSPIMRWLAEVLGLVLLAASLGSWFVAERAFSDRRDLAALGWMSAGLLGAWLVAKLTALRSGGAARR